jgi:hypothetical protein
VFDQRHDFGFGKLTQMAAQGAEQLTFRKHGKGSEKNQAPILTASGHCKSLTQISMAYN